MNVAHPDETDEEIADNDGTQESDSADQQSENAPSEVAPSRVRSTTSPIIINK